MNDKKAGKVAYRMTDEFRSKDMVAAFRDLRGPSADDIQRWLDEERRRTATKRLHRPNILGIVSSLRRRVA